MSDGPSSDDPVQLSAQASEHERIGAYAQARAVADRALEISIEQHGLGHAPTIAYFHQAAHLAEVLADYAAARALAERALSWSDAIFGRRHPTTATSAAILGHILGMIGQHAAGDALTDQAFAIFKKGQPRYPLETARALATLPTVLSRDQNYAATLPLYRKSLTAMEEQLGPRHPDLIGLLKAVAWATQLGGTTDDATLLLDRALALAADHLGTMHLTYADLALERGRQAIATMQWEEARPWFLQALTIRKALLPPIHIGIAECLTHLAGTEEDKENREALYEEALAITEQVFGPDHSAVATALLVLGRHLASIDLRLVRPYYERAYTIWERAFGAEHSVTIGMSIELAKL